MESSRLAEQCPLACGRRDRGGHLVAGQPGRLQPEGAPLTARGRARGRRRCGRRRAGTGSGKAAAGAVPRHRRTRVAAGVLQRIVDRAEHGPIGLHGRGDDQLRLEQPCRVGVGRRFLLRVHQADLDDAPAAGVARGPPPPGTPVRPGQGYGLRWEAPCTEPDVDAPACTGCRLHCRCGFPASSKTSDLAYWPQVTVTVRMSTPGGPRRTVPWTMPTCDPRSAW